MWHANDKKSVGRNSPADYEGKRCSAVSYSTGKLGLYQMEEPSAAAPEPGVSRVVFLTHAEARRGRERRD